MTMFVTADGRVRVEWPDGVTVTSAPLRNGVACTVVTVRDGDGARLVVSP